MDRLKEALLLILLVVFGIFTFILGTTYSKKPPQPQSQSQVENAQDTTAIHCYSVREVRSYLERNGYKKLFAGLGYTTTGNEESDSLNYNAVNELWIRTITNTIDTSQDFIIITNIFTGEETKSCLVLDGQHMKIYDFEALFGRGFDH